MAEVKIKQAKLRSVELVEASLSAHGNHITMAVPGNHIPDILKGNLVPVLYLVDPKTATNGD